MVHLKTGFEMFSQHPPAPSWVTGRSQELSESAATIKRSFKSEPPFQFQNMRPRSLALPVFFLLIGVNCDGWLRERYRAAFFAKLARLQSYSGLVREEYGSSAWTETRVRYQAPDRFFSEIVGASDGSWTGLRIVRNGATFVLYHPGAKFGYE